MFLNGSNLDGLTFYGDKWGTKFKFRVKKGRNKSH